MWTPTIVDGTPLTIMECDWRDDLLRRFTDTFGEVWRQLPPGVQEVLRKHEIVVHLASDRSRWKGTLGWAAFKPEKCDVLGLWFHSSGFAYVLDDTAVKAAVAHELAHALMFLLGEKWHRRQSRHPGPEWLVWAILEIWRYDPERAEVWRRYIDEADDRLPERCPPMTDKDFELLCAERRERRENTTAQRMAFLRENQRFLALAAQ